MKVITSVGEFLDLIRKKTDLSDDYFYRGESRNFSTTKLTASLYRRGNKYSFIDRNKNNGSIGYKDTFKYNTWRTYLDAAMAFYRNISSLTDNETQNFMAFCQHHGLSTPLLDISTSPLVALYFAAQSDLSYSGRLYIFKRDNFIPFDNKILSYDYLLNCYRNDEQVYPLLSIVNNDDFNNVLPSIRDFEINANNRQRKYLYHVINSIIDEIRDPSFSIINDNEYKQIKNCLDRNNNYNKLYDCMYNDDDGILSDKPTFITKRYINFLKIFGVKRKGKAYSNGYITYYIDSNNNNIFNFSKLMNCSMLLLFLIYLIRDVSRCVSPYVPKELEFYTHCTLNWGRVKAQKSYFIIQTPYIIDGRNFSHLFSNNDLPDESVGIDHLSVVHKPHPYFTLIIKNKRQILRRLNTLGINEMTLFMDNDSIADFIKSRYYI